MTKKEFCKKWQRGWREMYVDGQQAYFYTEEQMLNDLDHVIYSAVFGWKQFVDRGQEISVSLDEFEQMEAEAIQKRRDGHR